ALNQDARVIVDDFREQARSYSEHASSHELLRVMASHLAVVQFTQRWFFTAARYFPVGAGLPAKNARAPR
ncbi:MULTISPECIES: hypothetical protein, partial [unclassified Pseudomonas]|uniref:hypothetical protein n=1 Tax=unclassified Pseudomonas TaxID=196821 RepID=UPI001CA421E4